MSRTHTTRTGRRPPVRGSRRSAARGGTDRAWMLPALVLAGFAVLGAVAMLTTGDGDRMSIEPPTVSSARLPAFGTSDEPRGAVAPRASARGLFGEQLVDVPVAARPTIVVFLAHWCSHCQREVPVVQAWLDAGGLPDDVAIRAVATAIDPDRPNYPPDTWLEREGWTVPTLVDDGSIAAAYGLSSFPFWAFVDADGRLVTRAEGELSREQLQSIADRLASS